MEVWNLHDNLQPRYQGGMCHHEDRCCFGSDAVCEPEGLHQGPGPERRGQKRVSAAGQKLPGALQHSNQGAESCSREVTCLIQGRLCCCVFYTQDLIWSIFVPLLGCAQGKRWEHWLPA